MIVAEVRAVPVGAGSSMEKTVEAVREALEDCEVTYEVGPVGTSLEVETIEDLLETVQCCQEAAMETAPRVVLTVTIDERRDAKEDLESLRGAGKGRERRSPGLASRRGSGSKDNQGRVGASRAEAKSLRRAKQRQEGQALA